MNVLARKLGTSALVLACVWGILLAGAHSAAQAAAPRPANLKGAFLGALVADAMCLATHYEYDATRIKKYYGVLDRYYAAGEKTGGETHGVGWGARNFHNGNGNGPAKRAGEQTDYGDYNILVLKHLHNQRSKPHRVDLGELVPLWQDEMRSWRSWLCTQTRLTLDQVRNGTPLSALGGPSNAMSVRYAAAFSYFENEADLVHASTTVMFTHREQTAREGAEFFARVGFAVLHKGMTPVDAIKDVASRSSNFVRGKIAQALDKVREATDPDSPLSSEEYVDDLALTSMARLWDVGRTEPIKVGKASPTEGTLPGAVYFIAKYQDDFLGAVTANSMVGGDNAARSIPIGMILGAYHGVEAIPQHLGKGHLVEWDSTVKMLDEMPLVAADPSRTEL